MIAGHVHSCPTLCDPMDYSPPGSSVHGILQARVLEWVAISFSRGSSPPRDQTRVSLIAGKFITDSATREAQGTLILITLNFHWDVTHLNFSFSFSGKAGRFGGSTKSILHKRNKEQQCHSLVVWQETKVEVPFSTHW